MSGKVIQGSFVGGQPKWSCSLQPKIAPPAFQTRTVVVPPTAFAGPRTAAPPASAARLSSLPSTAFAAPPSSPPAPAHAAQPTALQRHAAGGVFAVEAGALGLVGNGGRPLPDAVRGKMEAALGADFSNVRVHVGQQAERIGAIAFTTGSDIYFAPGRYQPETIQGQQLLGHELAHVVQQRQGRVRNPLGSALAVVQDRALEAEADRLGQRAAIHRVAVQAKKLSRAAQPNSYASGPTVQLMDGGGKGRGDGWGEGLGGGLFDDEAPVGSIKLMGAGTFNFYYHKHPNEQGYHIKVDNGKIYCNFGVTDWGMLKSSEKEIKTSLQQALHLSPMNQNFVFKKLKELEKREDAIKPTLV